MAIAMFVLALCVLLFWVSVFKVVDTRAGEEIGVPMLFAALLSSSALSILAIVHFLMTV